MEIDKVVNTCQVTYQVYNKYIVGKMGTLDGMYKGREEARPVQVSCIVCTSCRYAKEGYYYRCIGRQPKATGCRCR